MFRQSLDMTQKFLFLDCDELEKNQISLPSIVMFMKLI